MVAREAVNEAQWLELLAKRLKAAIVRRWPLLKAEDAKTDSCRLCFSEADELPGLIVDKYGDLVILQLLAKGLDSAAVRATCVRILREELKPATILERPDPRMRELEGLAAPNLAPLWAADAAHPVTSTQFKLNGLVFNYDANSGQKTGAFLDQSANYSGRTRMGIDPRSRRAGARRLHLPGRLRAPPGAGFQERDGNRRFACFARSGGTESRSQSRAPQRAGGLGGRRCFPDFARLVRSRRKIRHHRAGPTGVREDKAGSRRCVARLQGAKPARTQNAASRAACW